MPSYLETKIEFLKGIGPQRAALLNTELGIFTFDDLLNYFPFRYEDRSRFHKLMEAHEDMPFIQLKGRIKSMGMMGDGPKKRLVALFADDTGVVELVWFQGAQWVLKKIKTNVDYVLYGKPSLFGSKLNIAHPELDPLSEASMHRGLEPVYGTTERLKNSHLDSKAISKLQKTLVENCLPHIEENLPAYLVKEEKLMERKEAFRQIHFPENEAKLAKAIERFKFEELFFIHIKLLRSKNTRVHETQGFVFKSIPTLNDFYKNHLPFDLTNAQKRVIREIYKDMCSGKQMNRLLQGDVGSGKTIVAFICMLMAIDNNTQACLMAPTEILATQHYHGLKEFADRLNISIALLTGSTKKSEREPIHQNLLNGTLKIIVGTHALLEDPVRFQNLGLAVIDEQHRFGVAQRAKLWNKNKSIRPHVLVMTATPIPRTLAMTLYGDLDLSVIDELPAGRKPIQTLHRHDRHRIQVFGYLRKQIEEGRQIYIVYPLIEESEKMDLKDLTDGYESITRAFPDHAISIVHGKMATDAKDFEMKRFVKNETKIMVATTVIEVGVNVPNASVMVIENAERFGLSQLHQLRGRVGRGADQSYCILMTKDRISNDSKIRIETMVKTTNGFEIADVDLKLRGPGDLAGTQQSGALELKMVNLSEDSELVHHTRDIVAKLLAKDNELNLPEHRCIKNNLEHRTRQKINWSVIS
ncbi:MAG TPA: ATP-dependent DNA helicase RecG [Cytophagaceae bacterium]|jgi:ATP-dependent DNA helicase RecG|nr:ATP-dependent DNA helicase RecG [Cytophagaceae bacterium]